MTYTLDDIFDLEELISEKERIVSQTEHDSPDAEDSRENGEMPHRSKYF